MRDTRGALSIDSTQPRFVKGSTLRSVFIALAVAGTLSACSSGGGGDGGNDPGTSGPGVGVDNPGSAGGLLFSYPIDGQTDVYADTQIVFAFGGDVSADVDSFALVADDGSTLSGVQADNAGNGIIRLNLTDGAGQLAANTRYQLRATESIAAGNTSFDAGDTLISFTTRPAPGAPSGADDFSIAQNTRIGNLRVPFTQFDPIRATFSEPVDEGSIQLCSGMQVMGDNNCTVTVTDSDGTNVPGRLYALGNDFVFDPTTGDVPTDTNNANDYEDGDLIAGETYTVAFSDDVKSAYGNALANDSFQVTPVSIGRDVIQNLIIGDAADGANPLNGGARNVVNLSDQLIGAYALDVAQQPAADKGLDAVKVRLAAPGSSAYNNTFPTVIPAGQRFQLTALNLKLGSQPDGDGGVGEGAVDTPVDLDNLDIQFASDANAYLVGNDLRNVETPTRVTLALDLNITGHVPQGSPIKALSNGVVNQTALNIIASGIAVPQDNGDVSLVTLGSFPIAVNRDGQAKVDFELELTLPASPDDQPTVMADSTPPRITAQYPSACTYSFNTVGFANDASLDGINGLTTVSLTEADCIAALSERVVVSAGEDEFGDRDDANPDATQNFTNPWADSLPLGAAPFVLFSEPVDPMSVEGNIQLTRTGDQTSVPVRLSTAGSAVSIFPLQRLTPDSRYTVTFNAMRGAGITDLSANRLSGAQFPGSTLVQQFTFTTEPMVAPFENGMPAQIDDDDNEAVRQTAPFLTALTPGLPCALIADSGDYRSGGDEAGRCVGDTPFAMDTVLEPGGGGFGDEPLTRNASPERIYPVFEQPANLAVQAYFSKPVMAESIQLADGCLIKGEGNTNDSATVAIQRMNGGSCEGVVDGALTTLDPGSPLTEGFAFTPAKPFEPGARYWVVICGSRDGSQDDDGNAANGCSTGQTITGQSGLALNTQPLVGTGTKVIATANRTNRPMEGVSPGCGMDVPTIFDFPGAIDDPIPGSAGCYDSNRGQGGPDIVMPFDGAHASPDYISIARALPRTDTNGNGFFDNSSASDAAFVANPSGKVYAGTNTGEDRKQFSPLFNESLGRERAQVANAVFTRTLQTIAPGAFGVPIAPAVSGFLAGERPLILREATSGSECRDTDISFDDGSSVTGGVSEDCIPVDLPAGGLLTVTSLFAALVDTGRLELRFPNRIGDDGLADIPQRGYIVPECQGTFPASGDDEAFEYDYTPCFVADLTLTVNGNDGQGSSGSGLAIRQQDINVKVFGPVAFEQGGRLVISTRNTNRFEIIAELLNAFGPGTSIPLSSPTPAGFQTLQLVGAPLHGGLSFPTR